MNLKITIPTLILGFLSLAGCFSSNPDDEYYYERPIGPDDKIVAGFSYSPATPCPGDELILKNRSWEQDDNIYQWHWKIWTIISGNEIYTTEKVFTIDDESPDIRYKIPGNAQTVIISLTVSNIDGSSHETQEQPVSRSSCI